MPNTVVVLMKDNTLSPSRIRKGWTIAWLQLRRPGRRANGIGSRFFRQRFEGRIEPRFDLLFQPFQRMGAPFSQISDVGNTRGGG